MKKFFFEKLLKANVLWNVTKILHFNYKSLKVLNNNY